MEELEVRLNEAHRKGLPDEEEEHLVGNTRTSSVEHDSASTQVTEEAAPTATDTRTEEEGALKTRGCCSLPISTHHHVHKVSINL